MAHRSNTLSAERGDSVRQVQTFNFRLFLDLPRFCGERFTTLLPSWLHNVAVIDSPAMNAAGFDALQLTGIAHVDAIDTSGDADWIASFWDSLGHWDFADEAIDDIRAVVWLSLKPKGRHSLLKTMTRATDGAAYWAVTAGVQAVMMRKALEWARRLGLSVALDIADNAVKAEAARVPPGARLSEFKMLYQELEVFTASIFERPPPDA